jgi:uncharacterized membrane protein YkoI
MATLSKEYACLFVAGVMSLGVIGSISAAQAGTAVVDPQAVASACVITKQQAETTALHAVGGGTVVLAVCEKDGRFHWSIDIVGKTHEYEVWVNTKDQVTKIITQPL